MKNEKLKISIWRILIIVFSITFTITICCILGNLDKENSNSENNPYSNSPNASDTIQPNTNNQILQWQCAPSISCEHDSTYSKYKCTVIGTIVNKSDKNLNTIYIDFTFCTKHGDILDKQTLYIENFPMESQIEVCIVSNALNIKPTDIYIANIDYNK